MGDERRGRGNGWSCAESDLKVQADGWKESEKSAGRCESVAYYQQSGGG